MRHRAATLLLPAALFLVLMPAAAGALAASVRYAVQPGDGTGVAFDSSAPMESFTGRTDRVSGWLEADLDDLTAPFTLEVTVDLASFDTGIGMRNTHMRENHLETDEYPVAVFSGGHLAAGSPAAVAVGEEVELTLIGTLDLHGVAREISCAATVARPDAATVHVTARFTVMLPDYAIERPKFLMLKLAEGQEVTAQLVLHREGGS